MTGFFAKSLVGLRRKNESTKENILYQAEELAKSLKNGERASIPHEIATRLKVFPLLRKGETLQCLVGGTVTPALLQELRFSTGLQLELEQADANLVQEAIRLAYLGDDDGLTKSLTRAVNSVSQAQLKSISTAAAPEAKGDAAAFLTKLLEYAISRRATDLTLTPRRDGALIKMRVNGELYSQGGTLMPLPLHVQLVSRIKVLSGLDLTIKQKPQDGRFAIQVSGNEYGVRVGLLPTLHGESIALRFLGEALVMKLSELGLDPKPLSFLEDALTKRGGLIIFVGPTGSGKTTTMYASLMCLQSKNLRIVTVEDPVEFEFSDIAQSSVNERTGLTYSILLRSVLRHDPDVILVGEMRDEESAKVAFEAAYTGHLILTTTHASSVLDTFPRLAQLSIPPRLLAEATLLVVSQRLIPKLCETCKVIDLEYSRELHFAVYKQVGCATCDYSGYRGKVLISEAFYVDGGVKNMLDSGVELKRALEESICGKNYSSLYESLDLAVRRGAVSFEQMMGYVRMDPESK